MCAVSIDLNREYIMFFESNSGINGLAYSPLVYILLLKYRIQNGKIMD